MPSETIRAIYRDGTFIPQAPCSLLDNSEVELVVRCAVRPQNVDILDPEARQQILNTLLRRMRQTSLNAHARHLSNS